MWSKIPLARVVKKMLKMKIKRPGSPPPQKKWLPIGKQMKFLFARWTKIHLDTLNFGPASVCPDFWYFSLNSNPKYLLTVLGGFEQHPFLSEFWCATFWATFWYFGPLFIRKSGHSDSHHVCLHASKFCLMFDRYFAKTTKLF